MEKIRIKDFKLILKNSFNTVFNVLIYILLFETIYKGAIYLLFKPFINFIISLFIRAGGYQILVNGDISSFFFSLWGILMILVLLTLSVIIVYYEFLVLLLLVDKGKNKEAINLTLLMKEAFFHMKKVFGKVQLGLGLYILVLVPLLNIGFKSSFMPSLSIPDFIVDELEKYKGGAILVTALLLFLIYLFAKLFIVLPIMAFADKNFREAASLSYKTTKGQGVKIGLFIVLATIFWGLLGVLPLLIFENSNLFLFKLLTLLSNIILMVFTLLASPFILSVSYESYEIYVSKGLLEKTDVFKKQTLVG